MKGKARSVRKRYSSFQATTMCFPVANNNHFSDARHIYNSKCTISRLRGWLRNVLTEEKKNIRGGTLP